MKINNNFMNKYNQKRSNSNNLLNDLSKNKSLIISRADYINSEIFNFLFPNPLLFMFLLFK